MQVGLGLQAVGELDTAGQCAYRLSVLAPVRTCELITAGPTVFDIKEAREVADYAKREARCGGDSCWSEF
ncbi:hypothetical protein [Streptomyces kronopolitis]|uniref:hypothetical protein n=1 Tax=Streptomyces kronopolitis TaxID=1612435 RepID=UPI0016681CF7|nr:hypothetical protein [Streptomyces kronopolitis]